MSITDFGGGDKDKQGTQGGTQGMHGKRYTNGAASAAPGDASRPLGPRPVTPADQPPPAPAWTHHLLRDTDSDRPLACLANAITAFRESDDWSGVLGFDESNMVPVVQSRPPWPSSVRCQHASISAPADWSDTDSILAAEWLQSSYRIMVGKDLANQAIDTVAREHPFHPIRNYLDGLKWDGDERIDWWVSTYLGVDPGSDSAKVAHAFGARFLISAVARTYKPGCQVDTVLILEGSQGKLKSTALSILAGRWFTDELPDIRKKDAAIQLLSIWILELAELDALEGVALSTIKKFVGRRVDRFRPPWGTRAVNVPRACVFAATVNHATYLRDETGGRRFWPIRTDYIDIAALYRDRDQLWAEAVHRFRTGSAWHLDTPELVELAKAEQLERYEQDPWDERIAQFLAVRRDTSVSEILELCIKKERSEWSQRDQNRVAKSLRVLGWERYKANQSGVRAWRYTRGWDC